MSHPSGRQRPGTIVAYQRYAHSCPLSLKVRAVFRVVPVQSLRQLLQSAVVVGGSLQDIPGGVNVVVFCLCGRSALAMQCSRAAGWSPTKIQTDLYSIWPLSMPVLSGGMQCPAAASSTTDRDGVCGTQGHDCKGQASRQPGPWSTCRRSRLVLAVYKDSRGLFPRAPISHCPAYQHLAYPHISLASCSASESRQSR